MFFLFSVYGQQYLTMTIFALSISLAFSLSVIQIKLSILRAEFRSLRFALLAIASTSFPMLMITLISIYRIGNIYFYYVGTSLFLTLILNFNYLFKLPSASTVSTTKKLILIAYPMIFHGMSISLFQYGDKIASFLGLGSEFVAQVVVISLFMTAPMLLLNTINNAWLPTTIELFKKSSVKAFNYLHKSSKNLSIFITIISIGIVIFSKFIVSMFVPNTYNQIEISRAIIIGLSFTPLYVIYLQNTHLFTVAKKFKSMAKITPIAAVIQFIFTFGLVSSIGLSAPAYGLLIAIFVQVVLTSIKAKSLRKLNKLPLYLSIFLSSFNIVYLNFFF
jgi:O-antigen/teichoic acid export membrane protein